MNPYKELLNYGIAVAILVPVMAFVLWAGRAVVRSLLVHIDEFFKGVLEQQKESSTAMKELAKAFSSISERCLSCISGSVAAVRDSESRVTQKFVEVSAAVHDRTFLELAALGTRFDASLTATAQSIRKDQAAMLAEVERKRLEAEAQRLREENAELSRAHDVTPPPSGMVR
jgi:hypothetical protein